MWEGCTISPIRGHIKEFLKVRKVLKNGSLNRDSLWAEFFFRLSICMWEGV